MGKVTFLFISTLQPSKGLPAPELCGSCWPLGEPPGRHKSHQVTRPGAWLLPAKLCVLPARTGSSARRRRRSSQAILESADFLIEFGASAITASKSTYICREEGEIKEPDQRDSPDNWLVGDLKCNNWQDEVQVAVWLFCKLKAIQGCKK